MLFAGVSHRMRVYVQVDALIYMLIVTIKVASLTYGLVGKDGIHETSIH